ncbi:MAG: primosomal protein N' [Clostridia bacterium]|nr:primosomal protein N' [Clostridia bacterium]MBN2883391.1 primosomal protein N' [Clostridia bacterium]
MKELKICAVILEDAARSFDKIYHYYVPEALEDSLVTGMRVSVPFGRGKAPRTAWFLAMVESSSYSNLKEISEILDEEPVLDKDMFRLAKIMRDRYFCSYGQAISSMLPSGMNIKREKIIIDSKGMETDFFEYLESIGNDKDIMKSGLESGNIRIEFRTKRAAKSKTLKAARLSMTLERASEMIEDNNIGNVRHLKVIKLLLEYGEITVSDFESYESISRQVLQSMAKKGFIEIFDKAIQRYETDDWDVTGYIRHPLNDMQEKAVKTITGSMEKGEFDEFLLHGITGSGKTEVYLNLAEKAVSMGRQVIVLVPEISLTPLMIRRFLARFPGELAVLHSKLSMGERYDQWMLIKDGKVSIALGARSCIFAPFANLGLVIIDEEHEPSFISENTPRYSALDIASMRCRLGKAVLVAGSATPSVVTYHDFKQKNRVIELLKRAGSGNLPDVEVVDMKEELKSGNHSLLSRTLKEKLKQNIGQGNQSMLFLNRRGYSSFILCKDCGNTNICGNCDVSMTYHRNIDSLVCHYCGRMKPVPKKCHICGSSSIQNHGTGTQKVEEEIRQEFPEASVIRMDSDATGFKNSHMQILDKFRKEKINILIGTQMIAKGHDFPDITLVGILAADTLMTGFDYTSQERAFQLITQSAGRAGRGEKAGSAVIQAYNTDSYAVELGVKQNYKAFYEREMKLREAFGYPPFGHVAIMLFTSENGKEAIKWASKCADFLSKSGIYVSAVEPAPVARINRKYRYRVVARGDITGVLRESINRMYLGVVLKKPSNVVFSVDIHGDSPIG